jgi:hypothetical protein
MIWHLFILFTISIPRVDYEIEASLDVKKWNIKGNERVTFINNSPDTIKEIWFLLYPNAFQLGSTLHREVESWFGIYKYRYDFLLKGNKKGGALKINRLSLMEKEFKFDSLSTLLNLRLPHPLLPGDTLHIYIDFEVKIPELMSRFGHRGNYINLVHWYPKVAAYDSAGWHPIDYHLWGEFYSNFGKYLVTLNFPKNFIAGFTGEIIKGKEYKGFLDSLSLCDPEELAETREGIKFSEERVTVTMYADSVHDFAIVLSPDFIPIKLEGDVDIWILSRRRNLKYYLDLKKDISTILNKFGEWFSQYPYKKLTIIDGTVGRAGGGMEYPQLVIIGSSEFKVGKLPLKNLSRMFFLDVISHEIAHQWFYGILGNNEMEEAWLDEAFATYAESKYMNWRFPKDSVENILGFAKHFIPQRKPLLEIFRESGIYRSMNGGFDEPVAGKPAYRMKNYGTTVYGKGKRILDMLSLVVGDTILDSIFKVYCRKFAFKNPKIEDFIKIAEEVSGKDLRWFFEDWLYTTKKTDFYIEGVKREGDGYSIYIGNKGEIEMPVSIRIETENGVMEKVLPRGQRVLRIEDAGKIKSVFVDPYNKIPEPDEWNNRKPRRFALGPLFLLPTPGIYTLSYIPSPLYFPGEGFRPLILFRGTEGGVRHNLLGLVGLSLKGKNPIFYLSVEEPLGGNGRVGFSLSDFGGVQLGSLNFRRTIKRSPFDPRRKTLSIGVEYWNFYNLQFFNATLYQRSKYVKFYLKGGLVSINPLFKNVINLKGEMGKGEEGVHFSKIKFKTNLSFLPPPHPELTIRAGYIWGDAPREELFYLRGELFYGGFLDAMLPHRGSISPAGKHWIVGTGVVGADVEDEGRGGIVARFRVPLKFLDLYYEWGAIKDGSKNKELYDMGIAFNFGPFRLIFPLYPKSARSVTWVLNIF